MIEEFLYLSVILFVIGAIGVMVRRNALVAFMSVELMLNAANLAMVAFAQARGGLDGQVATFFVMVVAAAEVVIGMHLFKDIASAFTDTFGGRSKNMQTGLRQARESALAELRQEAHALGADAVVGIDLDYSEISGGGKSMLFLVASGTAVKLTPPSGMK